MAPNSRCIPNDSGRHLELYRDKVSKYLKDELEGIVTNFPPRDEYPASQLKGFWFGPTGIAYLFLQVSERLPGLLIRGRSAIQWAEDYMKGDHIKRADGEYERRCGIGCEPMCFLAVQAAISQDLELVEKLVRRVESVSDKPEIPDELLQGKAGALYLMRLARHWVPESVTLLDPCIERLAEIIMAQGPDWEWHGKRYFGAVHGDIGIITQLVLSVPSIAPRLEGLLARIIDGQDEEGNWHYGPGDFWKQWDSTLVQFCHGAPGVLLSLHALYPYFPDLQQRIDAALEKGRACIWKNGLLTKEPNLCHGAFGNGL